MSLTVKCAVDCLPVECNMVCVNTTETRSHGPNVNLAVFRAVLDSALRHNQELDPPLQSPDCY